MYHEITSLMETLNQLLMSLVLTVMLAPPKGEPCDHYFASSQGLKGTFKSPHYPEPYPVYSYCRFIFQGTSDHRIKITFEDFDLEPGSVAGCLFDYIDIFTIDVQNMKHLEERICGTNVPKPFISVHQKVELVFKSDYAGEHKGFLGHFEFLDERWQPFAPSYVGCGADYITGVGGVITSPNYPNPYPGNINCTWMIRVEDNMRIVINFVDLQLGQSVHCSSTFINFYNGFASPERKPVDKVCGKLFFYNGFKEFKSNSFRVVIRFIAGKKEEEGVGFKLSWTAVRLPKIIELDDGSYHEKPCEDFHCKGGEYCIDTSGLLCNPLPRYCIASSLRCNGVANCGAYDHSDEDGCVTKIFLVLLAVIGPIIVVAAVTCFIITCRRRSIQSKALADEDIQEKDTTELENLETSPSSKRPSDTSKGSFHGEQNGRQVPRACNTITLYDTHYSLINNDPNYNMDYRGQTEYCGSPATLRHIKPQPTYRIINPGVYTHSTQSATV